MSNSRWIIKKSVTSSQIGDELALLHPESGQYFTLNQTGSIVWKLLEEPHSAQEITLAVAEECGISVSECQDDIKEIIAQLGDARLIEKA